MPRRSAIVLTVCLVACLEAPTAPELRLEHDPAWFDVVSFEWAPPSQGDVSAYALDMRIPPDGFREALRVGPQIIAIPGASLGGGLPAAPELSDVEFRVRAVSPEDGERASNVVVLARGVRPPYLSCAGSHWPCWADGAMALELRNRSLVADALVLERRTIGCGGTPGPWTRIPVALDATGHVDTDVASWIDGAALEYRLSAAAGDVTSHPDTLRGTHPAPLLAPSVVSATAAAGGVAVRFRNGSACATRVVVARRAAGSSTYYPWASSVDAPPPGSSGEVLDPTPPAGLLSYDVWGYHPSGVVSARVTTSVTWPPSAPVAPAVSP
jgi:hypothetical protein